MVYIIYVSLDDLMIVTQCFFRCDLRIVSDANTFFIETVLKHLGVRECFSEINTNPGFVDDECKLRILPYHDFHSSPHGCTLCPANMCKVYYCYVMFEIV